MIEGSAIVRMVDVNATPGEAFDYFTRDMPLWFQITPFSWSGPREGVGLRFETGPNGRLVEVWDKATGEGYECARVTAWEPGKRLVLAYRSAHLPQDAATELEVRFEGSATGTRVTLEHRGFDRLPRRYFDEWKPRAWKGLLAWFVEYVAAKGMLRKE